MKINVDNIRKGRIFMPAINLFFHKVLGEVLYETKVTFSVIYD